MCISVSVATMRTVFVDVHSLKKLNPSLWYKIESKRKSYIIFHRKSFKLRILKYCILVLRESNIIPLFCKLVVYLNGLLVR